MRIVEVFLPDIWKQATRYLPHAMELCLRLTSLNM